MSLNNGQVDKSMEEVNLSPNLSPCSSLTNLANKRKYKSPLSDPQSSHINSHSFQPNNFFNIKKNVKAIISLKQKKLPLTSLSTNPLSSTDNEQLLSHPSASCLTPPSSCNATLASTPPSTILDRTWTEGPSSHLYDGHKRGEYDDNSPKSQLPSSACNGRYEDGNEQLCKSHLDGKCVEPSSSSCGTNTLSQHATTLELSMSLQFIDKCDFSNSASILHSRRDRRWQPIILPMGLNTSPGTCNLEPTHNVD